MLCQPCALCHRGATSPPGRGAGAGGEQPPSRKIWSCLNSPACSGMFTGHFCLIKSFFLAAHITIIACHNNARQLPCAALAGPAGEARRRPAAPQLLGHSPTATSIPSWGRAAPALCSSSTPRQGPMGCRGRKEGDGGEQMGSEDGDLVSGIPSPSAQQDFPVHLCFPISPSQPHKSAAPVSR